MFCLVEILNLQVRGCLYHFLRMPALVTEFPFLEMIHVRKSPAGGAPDDKVHGNVVMCAIVLKIYRRFFLSMEMAAKCSNHQDPSHISIMGLMASCPQLWVVPPQMGHPRVGSVGLRMGQSSCYLAAAHFSLTKTATGLSFVLGGNPISGGKSRKQISIHYNPFALFNLRKVTIFFVVKYRHPKKSGNETKLLYRQFIP